MARRKIRNWATIVSDYRRSGETQRGFCLRRKLSVNTLQYHLKRSSPQAADVVAVVPSGFVDLLPTSSGRVELELTLPSGAVLRLRG